MKKIILFGSMVLLLVIGLAISSFYLGSLVKSGVESLGPKVTKVPVSLDSASLSLISGHGTLNGLTVGSPEGFKSPSCIKVGSISVAVQPSSLFSDKILIRNLSIDAPELTAENLGANLKKLKANLDETLGTDPSTRRFQVDHLLIQNGKIHMTLGFLDGKGVSIPLPTIELKDLGKDGSGLTGAELSKSILVAMVEKALPEILDHASKAGGEAVKDAGQLIKGVGELFKK